MLQRSIKKLLKLGLSHKALPVCSGSRTCVLPILVCIFLTTACHQGPYQSADLSPKNEDNSYDEIDLPIVKMSTVYGDILLALDTKNAPVSAGNFLRYINEEKLDGLGFYRNVTHINDNHELKIAVLQGGLNAALDDKFAPAFPPIIHEPTSKTGLSHVRGSISMARGLPGTAQTEFFISTVDNPPLDAGSLRFPDGLGFAVFGYVISGMAVVDTIAKLTSTKEHPDPYVQGQILNELVAIKVVQVKN